MRKDFRESKALSTLAFFSVFPTVAQPQAALAVLVMGKHYCKLGTVVFTTVLGNPDQSRSS